MRAQPEAVAIVGAGGIFPDAPTPERFWENLLRRRCAAKTVPEGRWPLDPRAVYDPARGAPDKLYSLKACFVEDFAFDPSELALDPEWARALDPVFHLALSAARTAFAQARIACAERERTGVIIGQLALPTDAASAYSRQLLTPSFAREALGLAASPVAASCCVGVEATARTCSARSGIWLSTGCS